MTQAKATNVGGLKKIRRVLFIGHDTPGSKFLLDKIIDQHPDLQWQIVITEGIYYGRSSLDSSIKLLKESSFLFCLARAVTVWSYKFRGKTIASDCKRKGITFHRTHDVNDVDTLRFARDFGPDLLVSLYTMHLYNRDILAIPKLGSISSHPSILPNYRGLEVFFWAMANGDKNIGSSVFFINERLDDGLVIRDRLSELPSHYSMYDTYWLITRMACKLILQAMADIDADCAAARRPEGRGTYYPMPTRESVRRFRKLGKTFF